METLALFREPAWLVLLVVPAALLLWNWRGRRAAVVLPVDGARLRSRPVLRGLLTAAESVPALLLGLAIVLLAGPQSWGAPASKRALTNIQFCVDVSGSMLARFGEGNRYDAAMKAIDNFLDRRQGDAFGLTFFGHSVLHWVPLTNDPSALRCAPPFMRPDQIPYWFNGTAIGKALGACRQVLLERQEGDRMILLVSDGASADLYGGRDEEVARTLRQDGIVVYAVHIGGNVIPDSVVRIASATGGEAFLSEDQAGLERVFARIDGMQRARMEKTQAEATDHFVPFCLVGLCLSVLFLLCSFGLRATPW